jgi:hypothetical protein
MKVSMQVTLEGLLRALRWRAHTVAEDLSASRRTARRGARDKVQSRPDYQPAMRDRSDDRARR